MGFSQNLATFIIKFQNDKYYRRRPFQYFQDLKAEHDRLMKKKQECQDRERLEQQRKKRKRMKNVFKN